LKAKYGINISILCGCGKSGSQGASGQIYDPSERSNLFLLHAEELMPQVVLANFFKKNGKTQFQFYTTTYPHTMQPSHDLP
jgi:hypothetical protein